jgi:hypothetical protein
LSTESLLSTITPRACAAVQGCVRSLVKLRNTTAVLRVPAVTAVCAAAGTTSALVGQNTVP